MSVKDFIDILDELLAVETDIGFIKNIFIKDNVLTVRISDNTEFTITVN